MSRARRNHILADLNDSFLSEQIAVSAVVDSPYIFVAHKQSLATGPPILMNIPTWPKLLRMAAWFGPPTGLAPTLTISCTKKYTQGIGK